MNADQFIAAFGHFLDGRSDDAVAVVRQIEAAEQRAGKTTVAARLRRLLERRVGNMVRLPEAPPGIAFWRGVRDLESVILPASAKREVETFVDEWGARAAALRAGDQSGRPAPPPALRAGVHFPRRLVSAGRGHGRYGVTGSVQTILAALGPFRFHVGREQDLQDASPPRWPPPALSPSASSASRAGRSTSTWRWGGWASSARWTARTARSPASSRAAHVLPSMRDWYEKNVVQAADAEVCIRERL